MKHTWLIQLLLPAMAFCQGKQIMLDDIFSKNLFRAETVPGFKSMRDGHFYNETNDRGLLKKDFITGETRDTLVFAAEVKDEKGNLLSLSDYQWSSDEKQLLIFKDRENIYRRSTKAITYAYNIQAKKSVKIDDEKIMHTTFSPDAGKVAFVKNNDLFYKDLQTNKTTRITTDGKWNNIVNGNSDWVYEEEFSLSKAFQWSPKGTYLAYYKFNESKVPEFSMSMYKDLYPNIYSYKYPKAGDVNSVLQIHTYNINTAIDVTMNIGKETDIYIPRIKWTKDENRLGIAWMNRLQNNLRWLVADAASGATSTLYEETNKYYIEMKDDIAFLENGKQFIQTSERNGYNHLYLLSMDGKTIIQLTTGKYDVDNVLGVDEKNKLVYYTAAFASPMDRQLFAVSYAGIKPSIQQITTTPGFHNISMNADLSYYVDNYSTINTPPVISVYDVKGKLIKVLKDNSALKQKVKDYSFGKIEFIKIPTSKGDTLNGYILKPANFDPSKKYPLLFYNYGGPRSQEIKDEWPGATRKQYHQLLAQKGYIIASVDNTGTGFRGEEFKKKTYLQLGKLEIEDQIDAAKYLGKLSYINNKRIGHWGWSYGGFMSCLAIEKGADVYKMAIAVSPVTNWRYYDNIYTERYMRTPQENPKGYDENAPEKMVDKIKGNFLILHGTGDDNVHFQNSVMMIENMIQKNIEFESGFYPNKAHGISGGNSQYHIYNKMMNYILKNL